jgi:hypothetical protein
MRLLAEVLVETTLETLPQDGIVPDEEFVPKAFEMFLESHKTRATTRRADTGVEQIAPAAGASRIKFGLDRQ